MHYFLTYERVLHSAQVWCVDVSLLIRSIRYWIFLFYLALQSMSRLVHKRRRNSWLSNPRRLLSKMTATVTPTPRSRLFEVRGSPQQSAAKKQRITAFALDIESLLPHLKQFLQAVKNYFTQTTQSVWKGSRLR